MPSSSWSTLPWELWCHVFTFLDLAALRQASCVSTQFKELAEPELYSDILILHGSQARALADSFLAEPRRVDWVQSLLVSTKFGDDSGLNALPPFIAHMNNLRSLRLETPDCNAKLPEDRVGWINLQDRYERVFASSSILLPTAESRCLPRLETCTIHFVDAKTEIYSMTKYCMLLLHPNIRSLTISCASTDFLHRLPRPFLMDRALRKSTRLEHLHLEECDIDPRTLSVLLSLPHQLTSLKISEGVRYDGSFFTFYTGRNSRLHGNVQPPAFVEALSQHCAKSLISLSLGLGYCRSETRSLNDYAQHLNLTAFENIRFLEADWRTMTVIAHVWPGEDCDHSTWRRLPPNLETFKIFGTPLCSRGLPSGYMPLQPCFIKEKKLHGVEKLKNLIYSYEYSSRDENDTPDESDDDDGDTPHISQIEKRQTRLIEECVKQQNVFRRSATRLEIEMKVLPAGFIPPYLHPEESPRTFMLWESARAKQNLGTPPPSLS